MLWSSLWEFTFARKSTSKISVIASWHFRRKQKSPDIVCNKSASVFHITELFRHPVLLGLLLWRDTRGTISNDEEVHCRDLNLHFPAPSFVDFRISSHIFAYFPDQIKDIRSSKEQRGLTCIPILDAEWTTGGSEVGSTTRLDSTWLPCFLTVGELMRNPMKMPDVWLWNAENRQADDIQCILERISCELSAVQKKRATRAKPAQLLRSLHRGDRLWVIVKPLPNSGPK
jgi:hypothetical protein